MTRKEKDHLRYMADAEKRKVKQRAYYRDNRERILAWHKAYRQHQKEVSYEI